MVSGPATEIAQSGDGIARKLNGPASWQTKLSAWLPVLFCVIMIAIESTPFFGADHTVGPLRKLAESIFGPFPDAEWAKLHHYIRKGGHLTGYGIVSLAWFRAFWITFRPFETFDRRRWMVHFLAMAGTFALACADEFHQTFLPNRTGTVTDVIVDCFGALVLQTLLWLIMQRRLDR